MVLHIHTVVARAGTGRRTVPSGPGSLPVRVGDNGGGVVIADRPGTGAMGDKK
jgi:hypothetical protein